MSENEVKAVIDQWRWSSRLTQLGHLINSVGSHGWQGLQAGSGGRSAGQGGTGAEGCRIRGSAE